jgi:hypothetical protein
MAYQVTINPFTGQLQLVTRANVGSVSGIPPTTINAIATWADTTGTTIQNSETYVQASGAIEAQGFITNRQVTGTVTVNGTESWIAPGLQLEPGAVIILNPGAELIII